MKIRRIKYTVISYKKFKSGYNLCAPKPSIQTHAYRRERVVVCRADADCQRKYLQNEYAPLMSIPIH